MKSQTPSKKRRTPSTHTAKPQSETTILAACVFGIAVAILLCIALALICTVICVASGAADKLLTPLSFISVVIVYFAGGFAASRKKAAALPVGSLCGAVLSLVFFMVSLCIDASLSSGLPLVVSLLIRLSLIIVSIFGALLGTNARKPHRRKR